MRQSLTLGNAENCQRDQPRGNLYGVMLDAWIRELSSLVYMLTKAVSLVNRVLAINCNEQPQH